MTPQLPPLAAARPRERGQVLVLALVFTLLVLLGMAAMVIDVGYAYYAQRSLQSSTDAAALAGAQELPDIARAQTVATSYGGQPGGKNAHNNIPGVTTTVTSKCISSIGECKPANAIVVTENVARLPTIFARVIGIDHFSVTARSTAAMGQGVPKPAHIMVIFDRTNSMNQSCTAGSNKANCVRDGIRAFLQGMDPKYNKVGLIVYPPGNGGNPCTFTPHSVDGPTTDYDAFPNGYLVVPLSNDYKKADGTLNTSSSPRVHGQLRQGPGHHGNGTRDRQGATGAGRKPRSRRSRRNHLPHGRRGQLWAMPDSNGDQNCENNASPYRSTPCHQAASSGKAATAAGTWVYGIAYDAQGVECWGWRSSGTGTDGNSCNKKNGYQFRCKEQPTITAVSMVQQIASDPTKFFNQPNPGDLTEVFKSIAVDLSGPTLVDNDTS